MSVTTSPYFSAHPAVRASDADREQSLRELRWHWMAGRLDLAEYEDRCAQSMQARYLTDLAAAARELPSPPPPAPVVVVTREPQRAGVASLSLGITGLVLLMLSMGLLSLVSLPLSVSAWTFGRTARRRRSEGGGSLAVAGEILGIVGTVLGCLALTACAVFID